MLYFGFIPDRYRGNSPILLPSLPRESIFAAFAVAVAVVCAVAANRVDTPHVAASSVNPAVSTASTVNAVAGLTDNVPFFTSGARAGTFCMHDLY